MTTLTTNRIESIDFLKGFVMVLMALDHTRDFWHQTFNLLDLTSPEHTYFSIYFTRWITHFCAPAFSLLAGLSAWFVGRRKSKPQLSRFLFTRGLWLIFIELTIVSFAWYFDVHFGNMDLAVIWSLGASMIILSLLIHLPVEVILVISVVTIFGHNALDSIHFDDSAIWSILHESATLHLTDNFTINVVYPLIPWFAVMALGYSLGSLYDRTVAKQNRRRVFNILGIGSLFLFFVIRGINLYGDLLPWQSYDGMSKTIYSFMNVSKYPPSLLYLLVTLSGVFIFLANSENWKGKIVSFFSVYGRVPFFYYILHVYLIHGSAMLVAELTGNGWESMIMYSFEMDLKGFGFSLPIVYLVWILIVLSLYPLCKRFDKYKKNNKGEWWLSYL